MIGKILGNRYHIQELIGEGGMALVYKAECSKLCRAVAVKILRPQYASDVDFVERFRREARAAASLSHPNVVNIYDVGQEDELDYIVMEYIPGDNLKSLIRKEAPFTIKRALEITRQIAEALNHAHQRNIIHRDIKPHNILVTPDGQVKVTDFGIARAISASSFTQTGMIVGSVQYSAPEQAKGAAVGPQSDVYSLGCVLYEMLTGTMPFKGETTIAIAMQHLQGDYIPVRQLRPELPAVIENIVNKAMAKDPAERYPTALALLKDILSLQAKINQEPDLDRDVDLPTQVWANPMGGERSTIFKNKKWLQWLLLSIGGGLVLIVALFVFFILFTKPKPLVRVPNVVGKDIAVARSMLQQQHLGLKIINRLFDSDHPVDTVISQRPESGQTRRSESEVEVVISKGPQLVKVPLLLGRTEREAQLALEGIGLRLGEVLSDYSPDQPQGVIIKQLPEGNTQIELGASVSVTINSADVDLIEVPNFIGRPLVEVQGELTTKGLVFDRANSIMSSVYAKGIIIEQAPIPFTKVPRGTAMKFMVSSGGASPSPEDQSL